jgi:beta-galactosidase/beta-glucuronidase
MPDRATGFYGSTMIAVRNFDDTIGNHYHYSMYDPAIQTIAVNDCSWSTRYVGRARYVCSDIMLRILVHVEWSNILQQQQEIRQQSATKTNMTLLIESDWDESWQIPIMDYNDADGYTDVQANITIQDTSNVHLWWPHGVGVSDYAYRHNFTFHLYVNNRVSVVTTIAAGIRTIETYLDRTIQGQRFRVNHHDIYLVGGNWIGTDQALRYSASKERYCNEVWLHQYAGLNLIRVWGGGTAERDPFYDCADQYGILVYQEFWMTGDNNGRWAGNYSWPLDYTAYLMNVEDTIKRLRHHPSLLFYGGCNECLSNRASPWAPNPPRSLDDGIRTLIQKFDPGRFYISSSMGGVRICITYVASLVWFFF